VEKLKQFASDVCTVGRDEGHSTHTTCWEAVYQQCNRQDVKPCCTLLPSTDVCSVSGPPRFVTLIACISSLQHAPGAQCKMESNWTPRWHAGREEKRKVSKHAAGVAWIDCRQRTKKSSHSSTFKAKPSASTLISDAWIRISKGWKMNTNSNLKFELRKSKLRLTKKRKERLANMRRASLELTAGREQKNRHTAPLSRQNRLHLISEAWIRISKGWKTNTNSNLKFELRKSELRLTTLIIITLLQIVYKVCQWKNFENWSIVNEDTNKTQVPRFYWPKL